MTAGILGCNSQVRTYHSLAKDVLKSLLVHRIELDFLNDGNHVVCSWNICALVLEPIEWHERDTASPLSLQYLKDFGGCFLVVYDILKEAVASRDLDCGTIDVTDFHQFCQSTIDAVQVVLSFDTSYSCETTARILIHSM